MISKSTKPDVDGRPKQEQKQQYRSAFSILFSYAKPHRWTFALMFVCTLLGIAADLLQPYLVKIVIDDHLMTGDTSYSTIMWISFTYLGLSLGALLFTYLQSNLLQHAGQSIVAHIRKELFEHISKQSMSYFDRVPSGSLITHVSSDTEALNQFFNQVLLSLVRDGMTLLFIIVLMFQLDAELTMYCLILLPIIALIAIAFRSYMRKTYQEARTNLSRLVAFVAENLAGMSLIQSFHQEKEQENQFLGRNNKYYRSNLKEIRTNVLFNRSFDLLGNLSVAFVVWLGGMAVFNKQIEFGVLYAFITYIRQFFQPINTITQQWNTLQAATVAANRIWSIFAVKPEVNDAQQPVQWRPEQVEGRVEFEQVEFAYANGIPVLRGIDLRLKPGEMLGIVGTTGAGKSSLISLLCRFYDVQKGRVRIDGTDVRDIPQSALHRTVGLVQQEPYLYSGTIIDNVRLFDESIPEEEVVRACKLVGADAIIRRMKDGYRTRLSERGSGLSAGERQLLSFARIVVFQPKILILDEATANLDSHTEQLIQSALRLVSEGRTTLVIAHRLSTIMHADRIIVMKHGRIIEEGTHEELLEQHGCYEELYLHTKSSAMLGAG
ncbi:ABC transporter ATP-binding protein [Paenibacillus sp. YYML68]|uniref:ABC transporter ATP-binding protein n=1 Tax=Paenibacillus sp. YYML68 TaxID=2909250 RepID=UPI0024906CAC|nr:ABC transporter ATP-binding protein [Paenibacillus sp. YYML68]